MDGTTCPDKTTCCYDIDTGAKCCSFEDATCCADGKHCCPKEYNCEISKGQCVPAKNSFLTFISLNELSPTKLRSSNLSSKGSSKFKK